MTAVKLPPGASSGFIQIYHGDQDDRSGSWTLQMAIIGRIRLSLFPIQKRALRDSKMIDVTKGMDLTLARRPRYTTIKVPTRVLNEAKQTSFMQEDA